MVLIIISFSELSLAQLDISANNYYQASHYISLHFNSKENIDIRLHEFYRHRYYEPAWLNANGRLNNNAHALVNYVNQHEYATLLVKPHLKELIDNYLNEVEGDHTSFYNTLGKLDISLSTLFLEVAEVNLNGLITPADLERNTWHIPTRNNNLLALMERAAYSGKISQQLDALLPKSTKYTQLKSHLDRYKFIKQHGGWPSIPDEMTEIKPGDTSEVVKVLKERLIITGDLDAIYYHGDIYNTELENGIKHFQYRHGLEEDGVVGKNTLYNLNIPVEERIRQIWINLEKAKWIPENNDAQHVWVNIPSYRLKYYKNGQLIEQQRVVVGAKRSPTPIFSSYISNIVINPYWNVPISIAKDEIAPKLSENSQYLLDKNYEVLNGWQNQQVIDSAGNLDWKNPSIHRNFRIRQKPGPGNALGIVKFNMPNNWSIYLHDTPSKSTFLREKRAYSHGCIRLHQPVRLAQKVLGVTPNSIEEEKLNEKFAKGKTNTVFINDDIAVRIIYLTAEVDDNNKLMLFEDVYRLDAALDKKLQSILI